MNYEDIEIAKKARLNAYTPYSKFKVGCALRTKSGKIYTGCNVDNHGIQSICAERVAFTKAISEGEREFESIFVIGADENCDITNGEAETLHETLPCGYCRQFMSEFVDSKFKVYTLEKSTIKEYSISDLLPFSFKL